MTMNNTDGALVQAYIDAGLGLSTAYEGQHFEPPTDGSAWASVFILPAAFDAVSLGGQGLDQETGIMQIDFNVAPGTGRATLLGYVETMRNTFIAGRSFTRSGSSVRIINTERTSIRMVDGWLRVSVSVNWNSESFRPAF